MKSILVIGLGRFGKHLCIRLSELGDEVMAIDINEDAVNEVADICTDARIGDCTKLEVLESLGVSNFDLCFVCIGNDFESSVITTAVLKELGAQKVVSKAGSTLHEKFLLKNGADDVLYAEREMAQKAAVTYSSGNRLLDYMELSNDITVCELLPKDTWVGKSIGELNFRNKYHVSILAIKSGDDMLPMPHSDYVFKTEESLTVMGSDKDIEKLLNVISD